jgi:hypothetical protein
MSSAHHTAGGDQGDRWIDLQDSSGDQIPGLQVQESTYLGGGGNGHRVGIEVMNWEKEKVWERRSTLFTLRGVSFLFCLIEVSHFGAFRAR